MSDWTKRGLREGEGNFLKYLKKRWNRKEGRLNKDFKKGRQSGSRSRCLKKGGAVTSLQTIDLVWRLYFNFIGRLTQ